MFSREEDGICQEELSTSLQMQIANCPCWINLCVIVPAFSWEKKNNLRHSGDTHKTGSGSESGTITKISNSECCRNRLWLVYPWCLSFPKRGLRLPLGEEGYFTWGPGFWILGKATSWNGNCDKPWFLFLSLYLPASLPLFLPLSLPSLCASRAWVYFSGLVLYFPNL